jgi:hypothetical protein
MMVDGTKGCAKKEDIALDSTSETWQASCEESAQTGHFILLRLTMGSRGAQSLHTRSGWLRVGTRHLHAGYKSRELSTDALTSPNRAYADYDLSAMKYPVSRY